MANPDGQVKINIVVNDKEFKAKIENVTKTFQKNADTINKASTVYEGFEKVVQDNTQLLRELALGGSQNTEGFKKLAKETQEYQNALRNANDEVNKALGNNQNQSNLLDGLSSKVKGLALAYISVRGAQMAFNAAMQSVDAFRTQERAIAQLNTTLANAGVYSYEYSQQIQRLASEIQGYSNFGDEAIIKAQALGQAYVGNTKITKELTKAVVDFASATGMDLEQAFNLVGKSIGSNTNALSRYGIQLQKGMTDSQKMDAITKQLAERYTGSAAAMADTSIQLQNALGDLAKQLGGVFNPMVEKTQKVLIKATLALTDWIKKTRAATKQNDINALNEALKYQQEQLKNATGEEKKLWEERIAQTQKYLKVQTETKTYTNKKPVKISDDFITSSNLGSSGVKSAGTANIQKAKDAYEQLQEAASKARREIELAAIAHGTSSQEVQNAFTKYNQLNTELKNISALFDGDKTKVDESKTEFQRLNEEIQKTKDKLYNLYLTEGESENFYNVKNQLVELETKLQDLNTATTNRVGVDWQNVSNSIRSNLASALTTPLSQGESAFQRLGTIGLNVVQMIGQEIIKNLLKQITLEKTLAAIKTIGKGFSGIFGGLSGSANGNVFQNGNVIPFAKGGIVNKPTIFPMANGGTGLMGEAGAEAVMPLRRMSNGRLGVEADTSKNSQVVNIYNYSGASVETRKRDDNSTDVFIRRVNDALSNERTQSGFKSAYQMANNKGIQAV